MVTVLSKLFTFVRHVPPKLWVFVICVNKHILSSYLKQLYLYLLIMSRFLLLVEMYRIYLFPIYLHILHYFGISYINFFLTLPLCNTEAVGCLLSVSTYIYCQKIFQLLPFSFFYSRLLLLIIIYRRHLLQDCLQTFS